MSRTILDQTQDLAGRETHRLTSLYPPPEFVKRASAVQRDGDPETQPRHAYAWPQAKMFPCHTAPATWLSTLFFLDKQAAIAPKDATAIAEHLDKAARYFGITGETETLKTAVAANASNELGQLPDEDFAVVWQIGEAKQRHWPLRNLVEVKRAMDEFSAHRKEFTFTDRYKIASRLSERASAFGLVRRHLPDGVVKSACEDMCAGAEVAAVLERHADMTTTKHAALKTELRKLAVAVRNHPTQMHEPEQRIKLATTLDQYDRETGLARLYGEGLELPEDELFAVSIKQARDFTAEHVATATGNIYALDSLERIPAAVMQDWMGDSFTGQVLVGGIFPDGEKLAQVVPKLDQAAAEMFDRMAKAASVAPLYNEATDVDLPLSPHNLATLATAYQPTA